MSRKIFGVAILFLALRLSGQTPKYVALTDQKAGDPRILVMDYGQKDWSSDNPRAVLWSWQPADSGIDPAGWRLPTEAKLRNNSLWGGKWVAVCDSVGFMAVVSYPGKKVKWSLNAGKSSNVHGIELLPNGNVAAAASTGGWVRIRRRMPLCNTSDFTSSAKTEGCITSSISQIVCPGVVHLK